MQSPSRMRVRRPTSNIPVLPGPREGKIGQMKREPSGKPVAAFNVEGLNRLKQNMNGLTDLMHKTLNAPTHHASAIIR
jgi:hypothetical protein